MKLQAFFINTVGAALALLLVYFCFNKPILGMVGIAISVGCLLLVYLGPDRLGIGLMFAAFFLAPQDSWRPGAGSVITFSDIAMVLSFALLAPRLLTNRVRLPVLFVAGAFGVVATTLGASALATNPSSSLAVGMRLLLAAVALPALMALWGPSFKLIDRMLIAYVAGQLFSTAYGIVDGPLLNSRYEGTTTHPNFFALCGLLAVAACIYLFYRVRNEHRWLVVLAGLVCIYSITLGGSRGALLSVILLALLYPLAERSAVSIYAVLAATVAVVPSLQWIIDTFPNNPLISRVFGKEDGSVAHSDGSRTEALTSGWDRFLSNPILGSGFDGLLATHNIYLQVAIGLGILGLGAWLVMIAAFWLPIATTHPLRRLSYITLAYLAIGMTEPSLWERMTWAPMSLALLAAMAVPDREAGSEGPDGASEESAGKAQAPHGLPALPTTHGRTFRKA